MYFLNGPEFFSEFQQRIITQCGFVAEDTGVDVIVDEALLWDAYSAAAGSVKFYNAGGSRLNHLKEGGLLGFWVAKLKPCRFNREIPPLNVRLLQDGSQH